MTSHGPSAVVELLLLFGVNNTKYVTKQLYFVMVMSDSM